MKLVRFVADNMHGKDLLLLAVAAMTLLAIARGTVDRDAVACVERGGVVEVDEMPNGTWHRVCLEGDRVTAKWQRVDGRNVLVWEDPFRDIAIPHVATSPSS